jgi:hypothetical protein
MALAEAVAHGVAADWMCAARGVRCSAICPGIPRTSIGETMTPERMDRGLSLARSGVSGPVPGCAHTRALTQGSPI